MVHFLKSLFWLLLGFLPDIAGRVFSFKKKSSASMPSTTISLNRRVGVGGNVVQMVKIGNRYVRIPNIKGLYGYLVSFFKKHPKLTKFSFGLLVIELFTKFPSSFLADGITSIGQFFSELGDDYSNVTSQDDLENVDNEHGLEILTDDFSGYNVDLDNSGEVTHEEYLINRRVQMLVLSMDQKFVELVKLSDRYNFDPFESIKFFGR